MTALSPTSKLSTYVGFDSITTQIEAKLLKRGFTFNLMVVGTHLVKIGRSGLGKSTLVNTLFATELVVSKGVSSKQTTEIATVTNCIALTYLDIEENGVRLKLAITVIFEFMAGHSWIWRSSK